MRELVLLPMGRKASCLVEQVTRSEIRESLQRVLASEQFATSPNLKKFLSYIIEQKLDGNEAGLKAYSIAIDAFGRSEDFDSQIDPIVRVQAGRLRKELAEYYEGVGANDPVRIDVPRGSYRPEFTYQNINSEPARSEKSKFSIKSRFAGLTLAAITVIIFVAGFAYMQHRAQHHGLPQAVETDDEADTISVAIHEALETADDLNAEDVQFAQEFRQSLSRNSSLSVIVTENHDISSPTDFIIEQSFLGTQTSRLISIELVNGRTMELVWGNTYTREESEDLLAQVTRDVNSQLFGASVRALEGRDPRRLSAAQLFVLATWVPGPAKSTLEWEKERVALARLAIRKDPSFGPAYSVLADKLAYLAAVDGPSNTQKALDEAEESAQQAVELNSSDPNTIFNVAQYNWHAGNLDDSIRLQNRVLELAPNHGFAGFFVNVLPFTCLPPPVRVLREAIAFDESLSADNPVRWVTLTWIGWLHMLRNELQQALEAEEKAAQIFQIPYTTIRRAAILNLMGDTETAAEIIMQQRDNWPNLSPDHFAYVTYPRICRDVDNPDKEILLDIYRKLAEDMEGRV
jgi:tetratricopeptide (TPR) repeat protein